MEEICFVYFFFFCCKKKNKVLKQMLTQRDKKRERQRDLNSYRYETENYAAQMKTI